MRKLVLLAAVGAALVGCGSAQAEPPGPRELTYTVTTDGTMSLLSTIQFWAGDPTLPQTWHPNSLRSDEVPPMVKKVAVTPGTTGYAVRGQITDRSLKHSVTCAIFDGERLLVQNTARPDGLSYDAVVSCVAPGLN